MQTGQPSRTALAAAFHRAAHQAIERGAIFTDPLALRILGLDEADVRERVQNPEVPGSRRMRIFIAVRHRFAEDAIAASGAKQVVILGAGLDTWAYRAAHQNLGRRVFEVDHPSTQSGSKQVVIVGAGLDTFASRQELRGADRDIGRVFEVDHPSTQAWKRERLNEAGIVVPESLTFAAVDFEKQTLADGLAAAGFDRDAATFFTWLGVVPYLTSEAIWSTLGFIASLPGGAQVVFDYANPPESFEGEAREMHDRRAARVAELGEAWKTYFDSEDLSTKLRAAGFAEIEDLGPRQIAERYFPQLASGMPEQGGHVIRAAVSA